MYKFLVSATLLLSLNTVFANELRAFYHAYNDEKRLLYVNQVDAPDSLLMVLHDGQSGAKVSADTMNWHAHVPADWLVIYPQIKLSLSAASLNVDSVINEYYFLEEILNGLMRKHPNIRQVYLAGEGTGAAMALEYAYFNPAVTAVAGYSLRGYINRSIKPRNTSFFLAHGAQDKSNPIMGGLIKINDQKLEVLPAITPAVQWAKNLGCSSQPIQKRMDRGIRGTYFSDCDNSKKVVFASLDAAGGQWPTGENRLTERFIEFFLTSH